MTPNFAEQAEKYALKMGSLIRERTDGKPTTLDNLKAIAEVNAKCGFLAGCEHGYRVGIKTGMTGECTGCGDTYFNLPAAKLYEENAQLKARLADAEKALKRVIKLHSHSTSCGDTSNPFNGKMIDGCNCGTNGLTEVRICREYFTKHPQDGAKGDL